MLSISVGSLKRNSDLAKSTSYKVESITLLSVVNTLKREGLILTESI